MGWFTNLINGIPKEPPPPQVQAPMKTSDKIAIGLITFSATALIGLANQESLRTVAYRDSGGVYTYAYGHTAGVKAGDHISPEAALKLLGSDIKIYENGVKSCITQPLTQGQFDAFVDMAYNAGIGGFCKSQSATKANAGDLDGSCEAIVGWHIHDRAGHELAGLVERRNYEYNLCKGSNAR